MGLCDGLRTGIVAPQIRPQTTRQGHQRSSSCIAESLHMQLWEWMLSYPVALSNLVSVAVICQTTPLTTVTKWVEGAKDKLFQSQQAIDMEVDWLNYCCHVHQKL